MLSKLSFKQKLIVGILALALCATPAVCKFGYLTVAFVMFISYAQNIAFSLVSRSRNRNNMDYHTAAAICSNCIWFMSMGLLVENKMHWLLMAPYTYATVLGSLTGTVISMRIERLLNATSDGHLEKKG